MTTDTFSPPYEETLEHLAMMIDSLPPTRLAAEKRDDVALVYCRDSPT